MLCLAPFLPHSGPPIERASAPFDGEVTAEGQRSLVADRIEIRVALR